MWDVIESNMVDRHRDRLALATLLRDVPLEMHSLLLVKKSAKKAREAIRDMRLGAKRVKEVNAQRLLANSSICPSSRDMRGLGENSVDDTRVVKKFLRVVPPRYNQVAVAIEMFCDMKTLSLEELVGSSWCGGRSVRTFSGAGHGQGRPLTAHGGGLSS